MLLSPPLAFSSVVGSIMLDSLSVMYGCGSSATLRWDSGCCSWGEMLGASRGMNSPWSRRYFREAVRKSSRLS